jgi:predicted lipoprotein
MGVDGRAGVLAHRGRAARDPIARRRVGLTLTLALAVLPILAGCKVVPIAADRAARERLAGAFDAGRYVDTVWDAQAAPYWTKTAAPLPELAAAIDRDLDLAGAREGRRAGDGSPWTFVAKGQGVVVGVDTAARAGRVTIAMPGADGRSRDVQIQVGPVVSGSTLRDSLPFVSFNDFSNQIAYAEVGGAMSRRAVAQARPVVRGLKVGDRVAFLGTFALSKGGDPILLTPILLAPERLERAPAEG